MARATVSRHKVERGITKITRTYPDGSTKDIFQIRYGNGAGGMVSDTLTTAAKARAALAKARAQVMDGDHINPAAWDVKFCKVAEDWIASHPDWKERTRKANQWTVDVKLVDLHEMRMKQITAANLLTFRIALATTPKADGSLPAATSIRRMSRVPWNFGGGPVSIRLRSRLECCSRRRQLRQRRVVRARHAGLVGAGGR